MTARRQFQLGQDDRDFVDSHYETWETIIEGPSRWVIIEGFEVPTGYDHARVSIALRLEASYPDVQIDMAYFLPGLARTDGKNIARLTPVQIDGKSWQQWSRHRPSADDWQPGDNIETHLRYVTAFLQNELKK